MSDALDVHGYFANMEKIWKPDDEWIEQCKADSREAIETSNKRFKNFLDGKPPDAEEDSPWEKLKKNTPLIVAGGSGLVMGGLSMYYYPNPPVALATAGITAALVYVGEKLISGGDLAGAAADAAEDLAKTALKIKGELLHRGVEIASDPACVVAGVGKKAGQNIDTLVDSAGKLVDNAAATTKDFIDKQVGAVGQFAASIPTAIDDNARTVINSKPVQDMAKTLDAVNPTTTKLGIFSVPDKGKVPFELPVPPPVPIPPPPPITPVDTALRTINELQKGLTSVFSPPPPPSQPKPPPPYPPAVQPKIAGVPVAPGTAAPSPLPPPPPIISVFDPVPAFNTVTKAVQQIEPPFLKNLFG